MILHHGDPIETSHTTRWCPSLKKETFWTTISMLSVSIYLAHFGQFKNNYRVTVVPGSIDSRWQWFWNECTYTEFCISKSFKIIKVLIIVITSQTFECFWISVTRIRSNHVNRNWYSAGQEIISIEDYLLLPFNSTELLEPHCKQATSKQTA